MKNFFSLENGGPVISRSADFLFTALLVISIATLSYYLISAVLRRTIEGNMSRLKSDDARRRLKTTATLLNSGIKYALFTVAAITVVSSFPGTAVPAAVISGVLGAALGFGAQHLLRDLIAGFTMVFEAQYAVGDQVELMGVDLKGEVAELRLRTTVIRDKGGYLVHVPNGEIKAVRNLSSGTVGSE